MKHIRKQTKSRKPKTYKTKKVKTQILYWKVLVGTMFLAVIVMGAVGTWTNRVLGAEPVSVTITRPELVVEEVETVEQQIRRIAKEENFKWTDFLVKLANCESRLDPYATNGKGNKPAGSVDRGLFMFNSYWQKGVSNECAFSVDCSTRLTIKMINEGKQHLWMCSKIIKNK
jgi:hypothetical protein